MEELLRIVVAGGIAGGLIALAGTIGQRRRNRRGGRGSQRR